MDRIGKDELEGENENKTGKKTLSSTFIPKNVSLSDMEETETEYETEVEVTSIPLQIPASFRRLVESDKDNDDAKSQESSGSIDGDLYGTETDTTGGGLFSMASAPATTAEPELETESQIMGESPSTAENDGFQYDSEYQGEYYDDVMTLMPPKSREVLGEWADGFQGSYNPFDTSVHISKMNITSEEEAREIANYILDVLEEDVENYFRSRGIPSPEPDGDISLMTRHYSGSNISLKEEWSDLVPDQPSTMRLYYEKGVSDFRELSLTQLPTDQMVDEICEVTLHRNKRRFRRGSPPKYIPMATQTREMTLVSDELAERTFRKMYPLKDDWKPPAIPSRKASLDVVLGAAEKEEPNVDKPRIGPKVKWSSKERLLPPLPEDYHKVESFWTGSTFRGEYVNRQFHHGFYNYPLMAHYDSEFKNGHIHSRHHLGLVVYPRGDTFEGQWRKGRHISGKITFCDDLEFEPRNWEYCAAADRRFYIERDVGLKQAGRTLYNNRLPNPFIMPGSFDTGDGTYDPATGVVTGYNGQKLRDATFFEHNWILQNCRKAKEVDERYVPSFNVDRLPCSYMENYERQ